MSCKSPFITLLCMGMCAIAAALTGSGDSAVGALETVPPAFLALEVTPSQAAADDTVTITFSVSEPLAEKPLVMVAGKEADFVSEAKAGNYTYAYVVQETDPLGAATLAMSGCDLVGNVGSLSEGSALEIVEAPAVPLYWFPMLIALLSVGMVVLKSHRRKSAVLPALLLLACPSTWCADVLMEFDHTWEYTFSDPTGDPSWNTTLNDGGPGDWLVGPAPFGNGYSTWNTFWNTANGWLRTSVDFAGYDLASARWAINVDNGATLYVNGSLVDSTWTEFGPHQTVGDFMSIAMNEGSNVIAVYIQNGDAPSWGLFQMQILAAPKVTAQPPVVSNVVFVQQNNGAGGTEVVISYDLDSPDGPCDVIAALSKDGGVDGYPFPVTSVTGDLIGVVSGLGKQILWDIAADYPNEDIPQARIRVTADRLDLPAMIAVPSIEFSMGRRDDGDDGTYGYSDELPRHGVTLSPYEIGKYEITNGQLCQVYNWANSQGYLATIGTTTVTAFGQELLDLDSLDGNIEYIGGLLRPKTRIGLPSDTAYSMRDHPVVEISWYGAAAYCNWLSEIMGFTPVYDTGSWTANFANDGYHLPTEAQWERAAAFSRPMPTSKHWIYSFKSDTLTGKDRCNYHDGSPDYVNPLGLTSMPYSSPAGWFDGVNVSPNGSIATVDSPSPLGCYDMSGNVWEWCHDWYASDYYTTGGPPWDDTEGPASGSDRVSRGGGWGDSDDCRSANRRNDVPSFTGNGVGFRLGR